MKNTNLPKKSVLVEVGFAAAMILLGSIGPLVLLKNTSTKNQLVLYAVEILAAAGLGLQFLIYLSKARKRPHKLYIGTIVAGVLLIIWALQIL